MNRMLLPRFAVLVGITSSAACNSRSDNSASSPELEPRVLTLFTSQTELFLEYSPLVRGEAAKFVSHFTVLATGEPVRSGTLTFEGVHESGKAVTFRVDTPARDGLFTPIHAFEAAGKYKARFLLDSPQAVDSFDLGEMVVYSDKTQATSASPKSQPADPPGAVPFLMEQQWKINMLLHTIGERSLVERLRCPGEITIPIDRSAVVNTPIAGRLLAPGGQRLPRLGSVIERGQLVAMVEPATPLLTETAMYAMELRTKAVSVQRDIDDALAQIQFARKEHERLTGLQQQGVSSAREVYEVERDLALAESQYASAGAMKAKYDEAAEQVDVFQEAARKPNPNHPGHDPLRVRVTSPISGVVVSATHVEGEQLDTDEELFRIADLDRVWVTTRVSEFDLARLPDSLNGLVVPLAYPDRRIDVVTSGGKVIHVGSIIDPASRTISLQFEIPNPNGELKAGMLADVYVETSRVNRCLAIPDQAVVMDNGNPIAFVILEGELCQRRELELGIRDAGFVQIKKGVAAGERVVTQGAYAIKLSSKSGAAFGPGHVH